MIHSNNLIRICIRSLAAAGCFCMLFYASAGTASTTEPVTKPVVAKVDVTFIPVGTEHIYTRSKAKMTPMPAHFDPCDAGHGAACPTNAPPTTILWSGPFTADILLNGDPNCPVRICYCTRETSPGNDDFTITRIQTDGSSCPTDVTTLVNLAYQSLLDQNPMGFICPPCGGQQENNWREVRGQCWSVTPSGNETGYTLPAIMPCASDFWCMTPFRVCCDQDGTRHYIQGATVTFGTPNQCNPDQGCLLVPCPN